MVYPASPTRLVLRSGLVERDWAIRDVYLQRFAVTALPRQQPPSRCPPSVSCPPQFSIAGSRPQHSLFRQERTASCKTAALAESNGNGARMFGATDGGSRVQPAGGYTVESFSVR